MFGFLNKVILFVIITTMVFPVEGRSDGEELKKKACQEARLDVKKDVNTYLWTSIGFFFLAYGVIAANIFIPKPPSERFAGKPPEYVESYIKCYKNSMRSLQSSKAFKGCVVGFIIMIVVDATVLLYEAYKSLVNMPPYEFNLNLELFK